VRAEANRSGLKALASVVTSKTSALPRNHCRRRLAGIRNSASGVFVALHYPRLGYSRECNRSKRHLWEVVVPGQGSGDADRSACAALYSRGL